MTRKSFDYIIENQRLRIGSEMDQFPFEHGDELKDYIMDQGGQPVRAMVNANSIYFTNIMGFICSFYVDITKYCLPLFAFSHLVQVKE